VPLEQKMRAGKRASLDDSGFHDDEALFLDDNDFDHQPEKGEERGDGPRCWGVRGADGLCCAV
jgi:hypothetical protein